MYETDHDRDHSPSLPPGTIELTRHKGKRVFRAEALHFRGASSREPEDSFCTYVEFTPNISFSQNHEF